MTVLDMISVGFGPSGIALAVAMADWLESHDPAVDGWDAPPRIRFLERNSGPCWQPGLLLRGADINHSFLRDFATPRDPRSRFTFVNYLKQAGRLYEFGHLGGRVARTDWDAYVRWCAGQLADHVSYDEAVLGIRLVPMPGGDVLEVQTAKRRHLTRALILSSGPVAHVPEVFRPHLGAGVFHSADFLPAIDRLERDADLTFTVIGSGQSAGEVLLHLYDRFPRARLQSVQRGLAFPLVDVGHFSNEVFFPAEVPYFHALSPEARHRAAANFHHANYSAVDTDVSQALYWRAYEDKVLDTPRLEIVSRHQVVGMRPAGAGYDLSLRDVYSGSERALQSDFVVLCTGYAEAPFPALLEPLRTHIPTDETGGPRVSINYRVRTLPTCRPLIYLNGNSERTHGASDSQSLSMLALRADRLWRSLLRHLPATPALPRRAAAAPARAPLPAQQRLAR